MRASANTNCAYDITSCALCGNCSFTHSTITVQYMSCLIVWLIARILLSSHRLALPLLPLPRWLRNTRSLSVCPSVRLPVSNFHVKIGLDPNWIFVKISPKNIMYVHKQKLMKFRSPSWSRRLENKLQPCTVASLGGGGVSFLLEK